MREHSSLWGSATGNILHPLRAGSAGVMTLADFALKHKLKLRRDPDDGTDIIRGSHDQRHLYEWSDTELAVMFMTPAPSPRVRSSGGSIVTLGSLSVCGS